MTTDYATRNRAQHAMMMSIMASGPSYGRAFKATCRTRGISGGQRGERYDGKGEDFFHRSEPSVKNLHNNA
jgi:hypothetical protein